MCINQDRKDRGSYTLEGALSISIFMVCILAVISVITLLRVEAEVQDAINQTAEELSQYAYAVGKVVDLNEESISEQASLTQSIWEIVRAADRENMGTVIGASVAKKLTLSHFSRKNPEEWLISQGIINGFADFDFSGTNVLGKGKEITIVVSYPVQIKAYGLFHRTLHVREVASTLALLPGIIPSGESGETEEAQDSIWGKSNFVRGQYFLNELRKGNENYAVKPGIGIDLYNKETGLYVEGFSINLFSKTYASCHGEPNNPNAYVLNQEAIEKEFRTFAKQLENDISALPKEIEMENGVQQQVVSPKEKRIIVVVPLEVQSNKEMMNELQTQADSIQKKQGISVEYRMIQEALF